MKTEFVPTKNFIALPYRRVSVQKVPVPLSLEELSRFFVGKDAYMATDYIVVQNGDERAVLSVQKDLQKSCLTTMFMPIERVELLSSARECVFAVDSQVDTGNLSAMSKKAYELGVSSHQTLIVLGAYGHLNFLKFPEPVLVDVVDLVPPEPSRLMDLARLALCAHVFGPVVLLPKMVEIDALLSGDKSANLIFPCRGSNLKAAVPTFYLDEHPQLSPDTTLVGCGRSEHIFNHFYGFAPKRIETCPKLHCPVAERATLLRCCDLQDTIECEGKFARVPWGCNLGHVTEALAYLNFGKTV